MKLNGPEWESRPATLWESRPPWELLRAQSFGPRDGGSQEFRMSERIGVFVNSFETVSFELTSPESSCMLEGCPMRRDAFTLNSA